LRIGALDGERQGRRAADGVAEHVERAANDDTDQIADESEKEHAGDLQDKTADDGTGSADSIRQTSEQRAAEHAGSADNDEVRAEVLDAEFFGVENNEVGNRRQRHIEP